MDQDESNVHLFPQLSPELNARAREVEAAAFEVHRVLGPGYLETVYEEALAVELRKRGIRFKRQFPVAVEYKGTPIGQARLDLLVADQLIVELKAAEAILPIHIAQLLSYLKCSGLRLGLLINFNGTFLRRGIRRVIRSR
jgi:GxxExxY protein